MPIRYLQILIMQAQKQQQQEVKAEVLLQIEGIFMHKMVNGEKSLFTSGIFKIARLQHPNRQAVHFLNLNSFYYGIQPDTYFIKVQYSDTVAYIFPHFDQGLSAISLPLPSPPELDQLLSGIAQLVDLRTAQENPVLKALLQTHYPQVQKEQVYYPDTIKKVIVTTGQFFGKAFSTIGGYLKTGVQKCGNYLDSKVSQGQPTHVSSQTKQRWHNVKSGASNFINVSTDYAAKLFEPVINKTKEYSHSLQEKINSSNSETVKYARQLAKVSGQAIGQAFNGFVQGTTEVTKELGSQGKKIITKKYGDQVINTFTGEETEKKEEETLKEGQKKEEKGKKEEQSEVRLKEKDATEYPSLQ